MKKFFVVLFLSMMCVLPFGVDALESNSYTTLRGVTVEKSLYDKMCNMYSVNFVETLSQEEFDNLSANIDTAVKETYIDYGNARGSYFSTGIKALNMIKSGDYVTFTASWLQQPNIHSFDVMAIRLSGCSLVGEFSFKQTYVSSGHLYYVYNGLNQTFYNGFGSSALLQYGDNNEYSMTFKVSGSGTVYGSYQHAKSTVSQSESQSYVIGAGGYGNVIVFGTNVASRYDQMPGVDINV